MSAAMKIAPLLALVIVCNALAVAAQLVAADDEAAAVAAGVWASGRPEGAVDAAAASTSLIVARPKRQSILYLCGVYPRQYYSYYRESKVRARARRRASSFSLLHATKRPMRKRRPQAGRRLHIGDSMRSILCVDRRRRAQLSGRHCRSRLGHVRWRAALAVARAADFSAAFKTAVAQPPRLQTPIQIRRSAALKVRAKWPSFVQKSSTFRLLPERRTLASSLQRAVALLRLAALPQRPLLFAPSKRL